MEHFTTERAWTVQKRQGHEKYKKMEDGYTDLARSEAQGMNNLNPKFPLKKL